MMDQADYTESVLRTWSIDGLRKTEWQQTGRWLTFSASFSGPLFDASLLTSLRYRVCQYVLFSFSVVIHAPNSGNIRTTWHQKQHLFKDSRQLSNSTHQLFQDSNWFKTAQIRSGSRCIAAQEKKYDNKINAQDKVNLTDKLESIIPCINYIFENLPFPAPHTISRRLLYAYYNIWRTHRLFFIEVLPAWRGERQQIQ